MAEIGLVTVLFNSESVLEGFLKSISIQNYKDFHLYIIDNTPSEKTDELLSSLLKKYSLNNFTHFKNNYNTGVAKGNNQGIKLSVKGGSKYTLLLNNDIEFEDPELFSSFHKEADEKDEALIIPKILFYDSKKIWMAGGKFIRSRGITNHVGEGDEDTEVYNKPAYFEYAPTCFMLINNKVFDQIGLMDEKYFVYYDDTDFIYRAYSKGYKIKYLPSLVILHKVSSSTGGIDSLFTLYYANRNRLYFIRKNFSGLTYFRAMAFTLSTRIIKYVQYDAVRRKELLRAISEGFTL